jgi:hypothetical protein
MQRIWLAACFMAAAACTGVFSAGDVESDLPDVEAQDLADDGGLPDAADAPDAADGTDGADPAWDPSADPVTDEASDPAADDGADLDVPSEDVVVETPENRFGIGLVGPGNAGQWDLTRDLVGDGGHIKLIFPGVDLGMSGVPADWVDAIRECDDRNLVSVVRIGPPWGDRYVRNMSDGGGFTAYTQLAEKYRMVAEAALLHVSPGRPLYFEIHNEPNLCYEWDCHAAEAPDHPDAPDGWMHYSDMAREYAFFLRDVAAALHAVGDARLKVANGGLAPGGVVTCQCDGDGFTGGITALDFMAAMESAVPGIWGMLDAWATHSYPASGLGYGFFDTYANSGPGLHFFEHELSATGRDLPVLITETGWTIQHESFNWTRDQVAGWTVDAYNGVWLVHPSIEAVMPFMLQDAGWDNFAWVAVDGTPYPVYNAVRDLRLSL